MKIEPLVSVIVAVSKNEENIYGCIESIIYQSYLNLEIILVINESYDRINIICNNIALMDSRIRIINADLDNKSNAVFKMSAFYEGLLNAAGSYAVFVDSNDKLHCDMIRTLAGICIKHQCQIACCNIGVGTEGKPACHGKQGTVKVYRRNAAFMSRKFSALLYGKIFDADLFKEMCKTVFCLYPMYYRAGKIAVIEKDMYFRQDEKSICNDIKLGPDTVAEYYKNRIQFFKKRDRNILDLSHEYYCVFLADFYIYQLQRGDDAYSLDKTFREFRREYLVVRYNAITPAYTKLRLGLLYHTPKIYAAIIKIFRIKRDLIMMKNLVRL